MYRCRIDIVSVQDSQDTRVTHQIFRSRIHGDREVAISRNGNRYVPVLGSAIVKRSVRGHRAKNRSDHLLHREQKNNEGRVNNSRSAHQYMYICVCMCVCAACVMSVNLIARLTRLTLSLSLGWFALLVRERNLDRSEHWPSIYEIRFFSPQNTCFRCGRRPHK